jgi:hypothetical protein
MRTSREVVAGDCEGEGGSSGEGHKGGGPEGVPEDLYAIRRGMDKARRHHAHLSMPPHNPAQTTFDLSVVREALTDSTSESTCKTVKIMNKIWTRYTHRS